MLSAVNKRCFFFFFFYHQPPNYQQLPQNVLKSMVGRKQSLFQQCAGNPYTPCIGTKMTEVLFFILLCQAYKRSQAKCQPGEFQQLEPGYIYYSQITLISNKAGGTEFFYIQLRQGLTIYPWLVWNSPHIDLPAYASKSLRIKVHATTQGKELSGSEDKCTVTLLSVFLSKNGLLSKTQLLYGHLGDQPAIDKLASLICSMKIYLFSSCY